ncbi:response regulator transcription factor [Planomonospora alba]|uniref:Response regulator transcription factor n=2 Tax=Planomonospora alba TaxID=161354 RepID=A0ABP6NFT6_9ACTN
MVTVLLVDDQAMIRAGLVGILAGAAKVRVVAEAADGAEGVRLARRLRPDAVLMDLRMPVLDGVEATRRIRAEPELAGTRVLVLTTFDEDRDVMAALRAGADGFLSKGAEPEELLSALISVADGDVALSRKAARALVRRVSTEPALPAPDAVLLDRIAQLTARERDIVVAVALGKDNRAIAADLSISPFTVKTHLNRAMAKLDARDRAQIVVLVYRAGLVTAH